MIAIYFVHAVDGVSAQTTCTITSTSNTSLTIRNNLMRAIELNCRCMDGNKIITSTRWFFNGSLVSTTQGDIQDNTQGNKQ